MLFSLKDLTGYKAKANDFSAPIQEVFVDRATGKIKLLTLDIGGFFADKAAIVSAAAVSDVVPAEATLHMDLSKSDAEKGPDLSTASTGSDLENMPKLMLGNAAEKAVSVLETMADVGRSLFAVSDATASKAANDDGDIGQVIDFLVDGESLTVTHVVVDTGVTVPETQRVIPISQLHTVGDEETPSILKITKDKLDKGPKLETFDKLDRHWTDKVAAYYGLS